MLPTKFSVLTLVAPFILSVSGFQIFVPRGIPTVGKSLTIEWTKGKDDPPTFTIELQNPSFNSDLALATTVDASLNSYTIPALQSVPEGGNYVIRFVKEDNINVQYGESPTFFIAGPDTNTSTVPSTKPASLTRTLTSATSSGSAVTPPRPSSTGGFGNTVSNSNSQPTNAPGSSTASTPASSQSGQPLNAGVSVKSGFVGVVAAVLGVVVLA